MKEKKNSTTRPGHKFVVTDSGTPWEVGPGFLKMVGAAEPQSDESRARLSDTILRDAEEVTEEEAIEIWDDLRLAILAKHNKEPKTK